MSTYDTGAGADPGGSGGSTGVQERVKETTRGATEQVQEKAQEVKGQARERASTQLDQRTTDAGEQMRSVADALRRTGGNLHEEGKDQPAKIVEQVADRVERLGSYLTETSGDRLMRDVEDFGRRRPWAIAGIGAALGLVASRFVKASSERRRYEDAGEYGPATPAPARSGYVAAPAEPAIPPATTGAPYAVPPVTPPPETLPATGSPYASPSVTPRPDDPAAPGGI